MIKKNSIQCAALLLLMHGTAISMHTTKAFGALSSPHSKKMCVRKDGLLTNSFLVDGLFVLTTRVNTLEKKVEEQNKKIIALQQEKNTYATKGGKNYDVQIAIVRAKCVVAAANLPWHKEERMMQEVDRAITE